jgi:hypothetical protein
VVRRILGAKDAALLRPLRELIQRIAQARLMLLKG